MTSMYTQKPVRLCAGWSFPQPTPCPIPAIQPFKTRPPSITHGMTRARSSGRRWREELLGSQCFHNSHRNNAIIGLRFQAGPQKPWDRRTIDFLHSEWQFTSILHYRTLRIVVVISITRLITTQQQIANWVHKKGSQENNNTHCSVFIPCSSLKRQWLLNTSETQGEAM